MQKESNHLMVRLNNSTLEPASSASTLLERAPTDDYLREWTDFLMKHTDEEKSGDRVSVVVFRLGCEWLAMHTRCFKEVLQSRAIHRVPHRNKKILLGIINLGGELQLCIALDELLEIGPSQVKIKKRHYHCERMIALISRENELWVFPVDEIEGIHLWSLSAMGNVPVNVAKSTANYLKGIMSIKDKSIGLLDEELLFYSLRRSIQ